MSSFFSIWKLGMLCEIYVQNLKEWYYLKITFRIFLQHSQPPMLQNVINVISDSSMYHKDICTYIIFKFCRSRKAFPSSKDIEDQMFHKTVLCKYFLNNNCKNGDNCLYAHGRKELRMHLFYKTFICKNQGWWLDSGTRNPIFRVFPELE